MSIVEFALALMGAYAVMAIPIIIYEKCKSPERKRQEQERFTKNREELKRAWEQERISRKIVEVIPMGVSGRKDECGGVKGAMLGAFLGGVPGAVVGAALPINSAVLHRFAVKYGNGEVIIRDCVQDSSEYKALMKRAEQ
jgi:hypothetical protein